MKKLLSKLKYEKILLILSIIVAMLSIITFIVVVERTTHIPSQMIMAEVSFIKAGDPIPFDPQPERDIFQYLDGNYYNSKFIAIYVNKIVPYFLYDNVTSQPIYPDIVNFVPYGTNALSIAGLEYNTGSDNIITINDRYLYDKSLNDEKQFLGLLTHELIHVQGYDFGNQISKPEVFEAKTQAASTEVLASMCNMQDEVACKAFWFDMYEYQRTYVKVELDNLHMGWFYRIWTRIFFWNNSQLAQFDKITRYNSQDINQYKYIIQSYLLNPYIKYLVPAVFGTGLDTKEPMINCNNNINCIAIPNQTILMDFDDTKYLLGILKWLLPPIYNF